MDAQIRREPSQGATAGGRRWLGVGVRPHRRMQNGPAFYRRHDQFERGVVPWVRQAASGAREDAAYNVGGLPEKK